MKNKKLKVLELFSGIRATSEALNRVGIEHETFTVEFNPKVQEVANMLHGTDDPVRDITKFEPEEEYDLVVAGFPCQPFSMAGKGEGFDDEKGRGKLYQDTLRVIKKANPEYIILENVKAITFQKHKWIVEEIEKTLQEWGYYTQTQIINSKNYLPQARERLFIFASKNRQPNLIKEHSHDLILKDFLEKEEEVSVEYYLTEQQIQNLKLDIDRLSCEDAKKIIKVGNCSSSEHNALNVYSVKGLLPTFRNNNGASIKIIYSNIEYVHSDKLEEIKKWAEYNKAKIQARANGDLEKFLLEDKYTLEGVFHKTWNAENYINGSLSKEIHTLTAEGSQSGHKYKIFESLSPLRIRSITPRESMRLMGWKDEQIDKIINLPKSKIYYTAGNSMVVPVMESIVKELLVPEEE